MKRLTLMALLLSLALAWGCASKQQTAEKPQPEPKQEEQVEVVEEEEVVVVEEEAPEPTPMELYEMTYGDLPTSHTVVKGDCLWNISEEAQVYNDPFMWPLIYKANRGKINDPDLIYPGQVFSIPRHGFDLAEVKQVRKQAGAPWKKLEPASTANLPAQIRKELGYGF
ncbi:LysM peptidoglycan-binding domain-containing protein [Desulfohalovibrio reitneri]|uniref:LysM peptidoglycan-binding domain-containing protein n=1 Tax=Desulfohalovibrio reitneri TaxID=1307759 RepID=UPI0004A7705C|nr:LysM peptidoglycan-binding domain-containing protein [Desulfohalovibrio reitneri]